MRPRNIYERRLSKYMREPPTVRTAARTIVGAVALVTVLGGVVIRLVDHSEYKNVWVGMWWSIQTVTTTGYGDVTPKHVSGRIVGVFVMLWGVAFISVITAVITTSFITRARVDDRDAVDAASIDARFDAIEQKLDRIEAGLRAR